MDEEEANQGRELSTNIYLPFHHKSLKRQKRQLLTSVGPYQLQQTEEEAEVMIKIWIESSWDQTNGEPRAEY